MVPNAFIEVSGTQAQDPAYRPETATPARGTISPASVIFAALGRRAPGPFCAVMASTLD
jgi:hypothetical protein